MTPSRYTDKTDGSPVRAFRIAEVNPHPVQGDARATELVYACGKRSVVRGEWFTAQQPVAGGFFVIPAVGAAFMTEADFMRRYELVEEVE